MSTIQEITHLHHKVPRHMGGTDSSDNLERLTIAEHAEAHKQLWLKHHNQYDFIAWQSSSGQITNAEATRLAQIQAGKNRKGQSVDSAQKQLANGTHPFLGSNYNKRKFTGSKWANNGQINKRIFNDQLPEGYQWGRKCPWMCGTNHNPNGRRGN